MTAGILVIIAFILGTICERMGNIVEQLHYIDLELAALRKTRDSANE